MNIQRNSDGDNLENSVASKGTCWNVVGRCLLFIFGCAAALVVLGPLTQAISAGWRNCVIGLLSSIWALVLTLFFVRWDSLRLTDVGAKIGRQSVLRFVVGFVIGIAIVVLSVSASVAAGYLTWARILDVDLGRVTITLTTYLFLACREELAFHGYPLRRLQKSLGVWRAQLFIASVFAAEHWLGGYQWQTAILGAGVGSLLFGMASIATQGLAVPIGLHVSWNFGQWILGLKGEPGIWEAVVVTGRKADLLSTTSYLVVMCAATIAFWLWHRRSIRR